MFGMAEPERPERRERVTEPTQSYDDMYADDGYVEEGVADPGTMQDVDLSGEESLEAEEEREEYHVEGSEPAQGVEGSLNPPLEQRTTDDAALAMDEGYMEDREFERDDEEGRAPINSQTIDPLEEP
jgi:hypothetical protein